MSIYDDLFCHDCKQSLWLGKTLHLGPEGNYKALCFHIGGGDEPPHWKREELNQVLWKFLADHTTHNIQVLMEGDITEEMYEYQRIGGDADTDISFKDYLEGWRGLEVGTP